MKYTNKKNPGSYAVRFIITLAVLISVLCPTKQLLAQREDPPVVLPYCDETAEITFYNENLSATTPPGVVNWYGKRILVAAGCTVYFDRSVSMHSCKIRLENKAKIIVSEGATLTTDGTYDSPTIFFGCTSMWDAIVISKNCGFNLNNTVIRDAKRGLVPSFGNQSSYLQANNCKVRNCRFINNEVGITLDFTGQGGSNIYTPGTVFYPSVFTGNTFTTSSSPLGASVCGIKMVFCSLTTITGNVFNGVGIGIQLENSFASINGSIMSNLNTGISATKNSALAVQKDSFNNVNNMVNADGSRYLGVKNCTLIHGHTTGISTTGNAANKPQIVIYDNDMTFDNMPVSAINVERSPTAAQTTTQNQIDYNDVRYDHPGTAPGQSCSFINITAPNGGFDNFPITRNNIYNTGELTAAFPCNGIYITQNASGYNISNNFLNYGWTTKPAKSCPNLGISLVNVNGERNNVGSAGMNNVTSTLFSNPLGSDGEGASWMKCSYHIAGSADLHICFNTTNNTYRAYHFVGELGKCDFAKNKINNHYYGWHCARKDSTGEPLTNMGDQLWHENVWLGTCVKSSAQHRDFPNGGTPFKIKVYPDIPAQNPTQAVSPSGWVFPVNPVPPEKENSDCVEGVEPLVGGLGGWDGKVIDDTYPYASAAQAWDMQRKLLTKLLAHPDYRPAGSAAKTWYDQQANSSVRKYADFEQLYYEAFKATVSLQTSLNSTQSQYTVLIKDIMYLDSLQNLDVSSDDPLVRQNQLTKSNQLVVVSNDLVNKQDQANAATKLALVQAESVWNNLPATTTWEGNRKTLYSFWLKKASGVEFTDIDLSTIRGIANQCPLQGGRAVPEIPMFLPLAEATLYTREDYWANCVGAVQPPAGDRSVTQPISDNLLTVFPNPAGQQVSLFLTQPTEATWMITDLTGRTWRQGKLPAEQNSITFDIQDLPAGLYICTVRPSSGPALTAKVTIQH